jgi:glutamate racemase
MLLEDSHRVVFFFDLYFLLKRIMSIEMLNFDAMKRLTPIGIFDSGYGGLTILSDIKKRLPQYDYLYLGDNARAPYGPRSFDRVYEFTLEAVNELFSRGCELVILACNTSSAKALRTIQQNDLCNYAPSKRVLGVIRPSTEIIGSLSVSKHVGVLATEGTVKSNSYAIEIEKFSPETCVTQHACSMWVSLIESGKHTTEAGRLFIKEDVEQILQEDPAIDVLILGCTHYPILKTFIESIVPPGVIVVAQGQIVAESLENYLHRHDKLEKMCSKNGALHFLTTENSHVFDTTASTILGFEVKSELVKL